MAVCWECDGLVSGMYGHRPPCSNPQKHEEHSHLPGPVKYELTLSCGHTVGISTKIRVGSWITCWQGIREPWRCQAQRRVAGVSVMEEKSSGSPSERVVSPSPVGYTGHPTTKRRTQSRVKESTMATRGRAAAAPEPEVEEVEAEDYTVYADKEITVTMSDFADWIVEEVYGGDEAAFKKAPSARIVALAGTLRMKFQASEMNIERREERRLEREAARSAPKPRGKAVEEEEEEEAPPAKPARRGRATAPAATPKAAAKAGTPKPATARRGRAAAAAAAPY